MAFTFTNYAGLPIPRSPMNAMIQNAMDMYNKTTQSDLARNQLRQEQIKTPYLTPQLQNQLMKQQMELQQYPEQLQANLFSKNFAPLVSLATSPLIQYMHPDIKQQLADLISGRLSTLNGSQSGGRINPNGTKQEAYVSPEGHVAEKAKKTIAGFPLVEKNVQSYIDELNKLKNKKGIFPWIQEKAFSLEHSGLPFSQHAGLIVPKDLENAQNNLVQSLVEFGMPYNQAYSSVQRGLTQNTDDLTDSLRKQLNALRENTEINKKTLRKGISIGKEPEAEKNNKDENDLGMRAKKVGLRMDNVLVEANKYQVQPEVIIRSKELKLPFDDVKYEADHYNMSPEMFLQAYSEGIRTTQAMKNYAKGMQ